MTTKSRQRELARQKARRQARRDQEKRQRRQRLLVGGAIVAAVAVGVGALVVLAPWESEESTQAGGEQPPGEAQAVSCSYPPSETEAARDAGTPETVDIPATGVERVTLNLAQGPVTALLDRATAPCTVNNFVHLADSGYYNDTECHRLTASESLSVLQCGDPTGTGAGGPGYTFADETNPDMRYSAGTVAMANAGPDTNGSQFFLVYADSALPPDYTTFGLVSEGMDVLMGIGEAGTADGSQDGPPKEEVRIAEVTTEPVEAVDPEE